MSVILSLEWRNWRNSRHIGTCVMCYGYYHQAYLQPGRTDNSDNNNIGSWNKYIFPSGGQNNILIV